MATLADAGAGQAPVSARHDRFFLYGGLTMAAIMVAGFSLHAIAGRSSFAAPLLVHVHALIFFGWVALFVTQTVLATGRFSAGLAVHRRLGWVAVLWIPLMLVFGTWIAVDAVRQGRSAPIFQPAFFIFMAPMSVYLFAGLSGAAIAMRRSPEWHKRLHFCGMAAILGPGVGRLLPMPLFVPWTSAVDTVIMLAFPIAGAIADKRRTGRVRPAWLWGIGLLLGVRILMHLLAVSPLAVPLLDAIRAGAPGAALDPYEYQILRMMGAPS